MNTNELNDSSSQNASLDLINIGMGLGGVPQQQQDLQQHPTQLANQFSIGNLMKSHTPPPPLPSIPQLNTPNNLLQHSLKPANTKSSSKKRKLEDLGLENISDSENSSSGSNSSSKEAKKEMKLDYDNNIMSQLSPNSLSNQHTNNNNNNITNDNNNIKHLDDINNQDNNGVDVNGADPSDYIDLQDPSNSNLLNTSLNLNQQNNQSQQQQDNIHSSIQGDTNDILSPGSQQQQQQPNNNIINSPQSPKNLHLSSSSSNLNQFQSNSNDLSLQNGTQNGSLIDNNNVNNNNNSAPNNSMNQMRSPSYYNNGSLNNGPPSNNAQRQPTPQPSSNSSQSSSSSHPTGPSPPIPLVNSNNCGLNTRMTPPPYNSNQLQQQSPYMSQQQINSPPPANLQQPVPSPIGGPGSQQMPLQAQMQMNQMRQPSPGLAQRNGQLMMNPHQHMTPPPMLSDQEQQQQHNQMMPQHLQMQQQLNPDGSLQSQLQSQQFQNNSGTNSPHMMIPPGAQLPPGHPGHPGHPGMPPHLMHQHSQGSPHMPPHGPPNMMNLVSSNDGHFLQQQNTIFVFTTGLANEASGAVIKGHFKSIIDFHRQLPATNEFLKSVHHQQQQHLMQQGHQQGMTPPPQQLNGRGPGLPLMQPNEQLTSEQLKKRTEKLGKLKDISSMICPQQPTPPGMNEMPAQQPSKRGRSSQQKMPQPPAQPPPGHNGPPQQFMNGDQMMMFPGDQFNPMMPQGGPGGPPNMPNPYQMDNKEWNRQNMGPNSCSSPSLQQQGPPPPYGQNQFPGKNISSSKLQKAGLPEKFDKLQPGKPMGPNSPASGQNQLEIDMLMFNKNQTGITTSGLQTTPSPQLMNYIEFEGQELIITKQLNLSYKGNSNGNDDLNNMNDLKNMNQYNNNNPAQNTNSVILNCLNNNSNNPSSNQSPSSASSTTSSLNNNNPNIMNDNQLLLNQDPNLKLMKNELIDNNQNMLLNDQMPPFNGNNQDELQQMHLNQHHHLNKNGNKNPNDPFFNPNLVPNNAQSPINLVNGGPLNSMLQMTNSIPKASPYATAAKSPGLNQFNAQQGPQMSLSPSPLGMQQHKLMGGPPDNSLMGSNSQPNTPQPQPQLPLPNQASTSRRGHGEPKLTKKEKQLQQQQLQMQQEQQRQQEMMMRGNMGMMDPNNPMQRGPPMPPGAMPGQPMNMPPHMHQQLMNQHHPNMNPMQMPAGQMPPHMMNHLQKGNMQPNFRPEFMGPNGPMNPQMMGQPPNKIMRPSSTDSNEMMFGPGNGNGPPQQFMNGMDPSGNMNPQFMNQQQMMMMNSNGDSFPQSQSPAAQASAPPPKGHRSKNRPNSQNNNQNGPNLNQAPTPNQMLEMEMNSNRPMQPQMLNGQQPPPGMMSHQMQQHLNHKQMGDPNQMFQDPNMNGGGPPNRSIPPMGGPNRPDQMMPPPNQMQQHLMNNPMMRPNQMQQQQFDMMNQQNQQMPPQHQQQFMNQQGQMMHHPSQMNNFMPNNEQMFQNNPNMMDPNQPNQVLPQMLQSQQSEMMMQMNMPPQQQQQQQQQMIPNQMMGQDPLGLGSDFGDPILFND